MVSRIAANQEAGNALLGKLPDTTKMWMSHGDKLTAVPEVKRLQQLWGGGVGEDLILERILVFRKLVDKKNQSPESLQELPDTMRGFMSDGDKLAAVPEGKFTAVGSGWGHFI